MASWRVADLLLVVVCLCLCGDIGWGDGCFVGKAERDLAEPSQKAVVYWKDGVEVVLLQVKYEGPAEDFAWVVPLPSQPEICVVPAELSPFAELSDYSERRREQSDGVAGSDVRVMQHNEMGVYDIAVLAAEHGGVLKRWLHEHGYLFPAGKEAVLDFYVSKKWIFVAMRIRRAALSPEVAKQLGRGELEPVRFSFGCEQIVYPLRISSVNAGQTQVLLYLLAEAPMMGVSGPKNERLQIENCIPNGAWVGDPRFGTDCAVKKEQLPVTWEILGCLGEVELALCEFSEVYTQVELTDDLQFALFEPVTYWQNRLILAKDDENARLKALYVLGTHHLFLLEGLARDQSAKVREVVARHPRTPPSVLRTLGKDSDDWVRAAVARNSQTPIDVLNALSEDPASNVKMFVAERAELSASAFSRLGEEANTFIGNAVARNPACPAAVLANLAEREDVLVSLAGNAALPATVLAGLARARNARVRELVAEHRKTPAGVLAELALDECDGVRASVAQNEQTPGKVVEMLAHDDEPTVRRCVAANKTLAPAMVVGLLNDGDCDVRKGVAGNPIIANIAIAELVRFAKDRSEDVRTALASNPAVPGGVIQELTRDTSERTRVALASNRSLSPEILRRLTEDASARVAGVAKRVLLLRQKNWCQTTPRVVLHE